VKIQLNSGLLFIVGSHELSVVPADKKEVKGLHERLDFQDRLFRKTADAKLTDYSVPDDTVITGRFRLKGEAILDKTSVTLQSQMTNLIRS
jgi:hypothetical protein